jgi:hypothetical protein
MAVTTLSITIPEAQATRVIKAICEEAGKEVSPANAKKAVIDMLTRIVEQHERRVAVVEPAELS